MPPIELARPESWLCRRHAERPGIGTCVACGSVLCSECSTRVEGGLHCAACLARWRGAGTRRHTRSIRRLGTVRNDLLVLAAGYAILTVSLYAIGVVLGPG